MEICRKKTVSPEQFLKQDGVIKLRVFSNHGPNSNNHKSNITNKFTSFSRIYTLNNYDTVVLLRTCVANIIAFSNHGPKI